jgi:transcriptional regulator with XRE-family HTH domain
MIPEVLAALGARNASPNTLCKRELERKGWTYRAAASALGVTYQHLSDVLNGHRQSRRLLAALHALPEVKS